MNVTKKKTKYSIMPLILILYYKIQEKTINSNSKWGTSLEKINCLSINSHSLNKITIKFTQPQAQRAIKFLSNRNLQKNLDVILKSAIGTINIIVAP